MRWLEVPAAETGRWRSALSAQGWLARVRIREAGEHRLVPLAPEAPDPLPAPFDALPIRLEAAEEGPARSWVDHLRDLLPAEVVARHADDWTSPHDLLGDLVILKLPEAVRPYEEAVGVALLRYRPAARLALADGGVKGEMRVRSLRPLAARIDGEARPVSALSDAERASLSTRTRVVEHGYALAVDPAAAYYSPRLAGERQGTVESAQRLRDLLGRPPRVVDPYAGVGPAAVALLRAPGLVGHLLAADLNPEAIPLLRENVARHARRERGATWAAACADARRLADDPALRGAFDLLLVNLPHDSVSHLPELMPLLARGQPTLVRGWAIVAYDDWAATRDRLRAAVGPLWPGAPEPDLVTVRTYSAFQAFARFEAWCLREESAAS